MDLHFRGFRRSKGSGTLAQCEDAFAADSQSGRFAVADGATNSAFTNTWSRLLVDQFVTSANTNLVPWNPEWLTAIRRAWIEDVERQLAAEYGENEYPWYVEPSLQQGAFSTFVGLVITEDEQGKRWRASAVGDTCLFHTRNGELLAAYPLNQSNQFTSTPLLLTSCDQDIEQEGMVIEEVGQSNDRLWVATDALAKWCLVEEEQDRAPWRRLEWLLQPMGTDKRFDQWIDGLRSERGLQNDDVTLLIVTL
jgi:hypothetical protein